MLTKILTQSKVCATLNQFFGRNIARKRIVFGLGSNLGDRNFYLDEAVLELTQQLFLTNPKTSQIFKNPAMLLPNSPKEWDCEFFNIAFSADIDLQKFSPEKILEIIKKIEENLGRKERERWAPREIDIDILLIEGVKVELGEKLTIPHRDLLNRDFFVKTVEEIEPLLLKMLK
ncbi:MAG: 2-amino-4-hydroxy-6-hydroxymethyldihydropteridine diphosphokinase [Rickettsiales bacterium]|nr:2-amino-4-hydroxy-6-hydroxymethyldihydropteridine diphosphokinase [Rickettsiales bacterium]